jgi:hypothetical protein
MWVVRFALRVVACAAVNFPAATSALICVVSSPTKAAIKASFFEPAIVPSDSPAARRVLIVALSTPIVEEIRASTAVQLASLVTWFAARSASLTARFSANFFVIASACVCVIVPAVTSSVTAILPLPPWS